MIAVTFVKIVTGAEVLFVHSHHFHNDGPLGVTSGFYMYDIVLFLGECP